MKLSQTRKIRTATVELGEGESFQIKFRAFTPNEWDQAGQDAEGDDEWANVLKLERVLVETGLEYDDDDPQGRTGAIPPTRSELRNIETPILNGMIAAVMGVTLPKKTN